ncbi:MAG TPA: hypothetical protein VMW35_00130 [Myxococcota bacterium]|jgi:hypothetical protein|nr:hypothetical protein [Myxococcota bacterium]
MWLLLLALGAAAYAAWRVFAGFERRPEGVGVLARREIGFLDAAADALFPPGGAIPFSGRDAEIPRYVDAYVRVQPTRTRTLMRLLFFLVEHATIVLPAPGRGGRRRFSALAPAQRVCVLEDWRASRLFARRIVFTSLRAILTMGYFAHPGVLRALGLAPLSIPSPIGEADLLYPRVGRHPSTITLTRDDLTPPSDGTPLDPRGPLDPRYAPKTAR